MIKLRKRTKSSAYQTITVTELKQLQDKGEEFLLIDVRSEEEYKSGHIQGARLLPLETLANRYTELNSDNTIIVICHSGNRSHFACELLQRLNVSNIQNLEGGITAWQHAGCPSVQSF